MDFDSLNKAFDIKSNSEHDVKKVDVEVDFQEEKSEPESEKEKSMAHITKDYEYTRGNLYSIIEKGQEAINGVLELAQESESPRAYEVLGQLIKNVSDATDKLLDLQKKLKSIDEMSGKRGPTNVTNALFIGSTAELSKLLKKNNKEK